MHFTVQRRNGITLPDMDVVLNLPGVHNVLNALSAIAVAVELNVADEAVIKALAGFRGVGRRFQNYGQVLVPQAQGGGHFTVIDDYGHHPTEIRVTLETARRVAGSGKVWVVFQPHRYSRTQAFAAEFAQALALADVAYVLEIYGASEKPIPGITSEVITRHMAKEQGIYEPSMITVAEALIHRAEPGDVILTLGAGDVNSLAPVLVDSLVDKYQQYK